MKFKNWVAWKVLIRHILLAPTHRLYLAADSMAPIYTGEMLQLLTLTLYRQGADWLSSLLSPTHYSITDRPRPADILVSAASVARICTSDILFISTRHHRAFDSTKLIERMRAVSGLFALTCFVFPVCTGTLERCERNTLIEISHDKIRLSLTNYRQIYH